MKQHVSSMSQDYADVLDSQCPHCFRHFLSPFKLQCHVEAVHSQYQSTGQYHTQYQYRSLINR